VLASNESTLRYWHAYESLGGGTPTPPPSATPTLTASPTPTASPQPSPRVLAFLPTDDTTIQSNVSTPIPVASPSTNDRLIADHSVASNSQATSDILLQFDVQTPGCTTLTAATLKLTVGSTLYDDGTDGGGAFYRVDTSPPWSESTVTWSTAPTIGPSPAITTLGPVAKNQTVSVNVTSAVTGTGLVAFRIMVPTGTDGVKYLSKEASTTSPPTLTVTCS